MSQADFSYVEHFLYSPTSSVACQAQIQPMTPDFSFFTRGRAGNIIPR